MIIGTVIYVIRCALRYAFDFDSNGVIITRERTEQTVFRVTQSDVDAKLFPFELKCFFIYMYSVFYTKSNLKYFGRTDLNRN